MGNSCEICSRDFKSLMSLARHLIQAHAPLTTKDYYDRFLKLPSDGICQGCNAQTAFKNLRGYSKFCSNKSCSQTNRIKELKRDPVKFANFLSNVSSSQRKVWATRSKEQRQQIIYKVNETSLNRGKKRNWNVHTEDLDHALEMAGRKMCYMMGMKPNMVSSFAQTWPRVNQNLSQLFGFDDHG